ncbi:MobA/MobL family protein [Lachnospiraceae bacterium ZAX-1]
MCADVCIHDKDSTNPHAHIMLIMRPIESDGKWGQKSRTVNGRKINTVDWNDRDKADAWRKAWEDYCNAELRANGFDITIDHRSYERQGVEQIPTVHLGPAASQMEKRGIRTDLKSVERRIDTLNEHIKHSENFKKYRKIAEKRDALYAEYQTLSQQGLFSKGKAQKALEVAEAFNWKHLNALQDYDNAEKYLYDILQGRFDPKKLPITKWREELTAKTAERDSLYRQYDSLKNETQKVEQIRRSVAEIMREESWEKKPQKSRGMEL